MEILEAYERTLDAADDLRAEGIDVRITPSESGPAQGVDALPRDKWVTIEFFITTEEQAATINERADELGWSGISFDVSGTEGPREWEVDWSFRATGVPNSDGWSEARTWVEDAITGKR